MNEPFNSDFYLGTVSSDMQALVFDLDGTLLQLDRPYESVLSTAFEAVCGRVDERWIETYDEAFRTALEALEQDPARIAFEATDAPGDAGAFARHLHEEEIAAGRLPEHARSDLDSLADRFSLAVLTNGPDEWQRGKVEAHDLTAVFDAVVTSYEAGAHKPDPAPYRAVESKLDAESYAMVGDSDSDIDGATAAGWESVRYTGQRFEAVPEMLSWES